MTVFLFALLVDLDVRLGDDVSFFGERRDHSVLVDELSVVFVLVFALGALGTRLLLMMFSLLMVLWV